MAVIEGTIRDQDGAVYNVEHSAYGAKPSAPRAASGGTISMGSTTLTAAAGTFSSADIGRHVWIPNAGGTAMVPDPINPNLTISVPLALHSTINAVSSGTQATLAHAAVQSVSNVAFGLDWNATGDIQEAIEAAYNAGGGRVLLPGGRVYSVMSLGLRPGVTLDLNGSTLLRLPYAVGRMLSVPEHPDSLYRWGGAVDSAVVAVRNGTVDGNRAVQGAYTGYERQQDHLMFFDGAGQRDAYGYIQAGRLRVTLENLVLKDSVADGITLYRNVDASITNVRATDCWRGALVAAGGYTRLRVDRLTAGGLVHDSGIDLEVDENGAQGYGGSTALEAQLNSLWVQGDFDVELQPGGVLIADNIICRNPGFLLGGKGSTVRVSNSEFVVGPFSGAGSNGNRIVFPHDMTFSNCTFKAEPMWVNPNLPINLAAARVAFRAGAAPSNQRLRFIDCTFKLGLGIQPADATYGIWVEEDALTLGNELIVQGCDIQPGFDVGIYAHLGLRATVANTRIQATKPIEWHANESTSGIDLTIDDVSVRGSAFYMAAGDGYPGTGTKRIEHRNTYIDEADAGVTSPGGMHTTTFVGGRVIRVTASPVNRIVGLPGDVAELEVPAAGQPWRWVCTQVYSLADGSVWKAEAALAS